MLQLTNNACMHVEAAGRAWDCWHQDALSLRVDAPCTHFCLFLLPREMCQPALGHSAPCRMAPSKDFVVQEKHSLVICRPTDIGDYRPLDAPPPESELRLQEALAGWVGPTGQYLHDSEWLLQHTPVTTFGTALAAEQRSSHLADVAPTPGPTAVPSGVNTSSSFLLPGSQWSSAISQIELLRQQGEVATCSISDGQPSIMDGGECGAPGFDMQLAGPAATSNNIVPVPQLGSVQVASMRDALQPSLAVASPAGQQLSSSTRGAEPAMAGTGPTAAASPSTSGNAVAAAAQQGVLGLAAAYVHPFCMDTPGSVVLTDASKGAPAASGWTPGGSSSVRSSGSSSNTSHGDGAALRTTDWPVLSGAPEHSPKSLWPLPRYAKQQPAQRKRQISQRMPKSSVVGDFAGHGTGAHAKPSQMPHRTGHQPVVLNDAAVLVPPEYYAVRAADSLRCRPVVLVAGCKGHPQSQASTLRLACHECQQGCIQAAA
jgi:hypothetical protein